jgi:hypothetical protein
MANVRALHAVADGLAMHLTRAYPTALSEDIPATFVALSTGTLHAAFNDSANTRITVWPYRTSINEHHRNLSFAAPQGLSNRPLPLDVHLLVSVWASTVEAELTLFAWTLRELYQLSVLDGAVLSSIDAEFGPGEQLQLTPMELSLEDLMRLWDGVKPGYRLSAAFVARVLHIDITQADAQPVVARRLRFTDDVAPGGAA